jgi:hypothetical protein
VEETTPALTRSTRADSFDINSSIEREHLDAVLKGQGLVQPLRSSAPFLQKSKKLTASKLIKAPSCARARGMHFAARIIARWNPRYIIPVCPYSVILA